MATATMSAGFSYLVTGMDGGRDPATLDSSTYAKGINVQTRGGFARTRPGLVKLADIAEGTFQGAGRWSLNEGDFFGYVVDGNAYVIAADDGAITLVGTGVMDATAQCHVTQVERYLIFQDGISVPHAVHMVANVPTYFGALDVNQMPKGTIMYYVLGRFHLKPTVVPGTTEIGDAYFISGDIILPSDSTTVLGYTEGTYLAGGGAHALPGEMGFIHGMTAYRNAPTGTGYGQLLIFGRNGISAFDTSIPRADWNTQQLAQVLYYGSGTRSPWSIIQVNDDVVYRALDGWRTVRYTQAYAAGANPLSVLTGPISNEVSEYLAPADGPFLPYVSTCFADNRIMMTAVGTGTRSFKGIISLDFANIYNLAEAPRPAYDGLWTGLNFRQCLNGTRADVPTAFVFTEDAALYYFDKYADTDEGGSLIESQIVTGVMTPGTAEGADVISPKRFDYVDMHVSGVSQKTSIEVYMRPRNYPYWAKVGATRVIEPGVGSEPVYVRPLRFGMDDDTSCNPALEKLLRYSIDFQFAIKWTGAMRIDMFSAVVTAESQVNPEPCNPGQLPAITSGTENAGVELSDFSYVVGG